jgi:hypothetical protein
VHGRDKPGHDGFEEPIYLSGLPASPAMRISACGPIGGMVKQLSTLV